MLGGLLGGLALFLYGMQMMSDGLEDVAGNKMKAVLEKLTSNRFLGVLIGALITIAIQSSSATTVMVVGFVNSGLMTLNQAVWIIMGANIGTTLTSQLLALDIDVIAPFVAFIGVAIAVFVKKDKVRHMGKIMAGLGILFVGMDMMGNAVGPLGQSEAFVSLMTRFSNPILGILAGAIFTAAIQSSAASIGILQTLATNGLIPFSSAVYVLFGQNIGTCITALLASIGTNRSAKQTTVIHFLFNTIGTIIFTLACLVLPITNWVATITPTNPAAQIANMHSIFNLVTTVLLLPFGTHLASLAVKILPDEPTEQKDSLQALQGEYRRSYTSLGSSFVHIDMLHNEINKMIELAGNNIDMSFEALLNKDANLIKQLDTLEDELNGMNAEVSRFVSKILTKDNSGESVESIKEYFAITGDAERIGDHALNIGEFAQSCIDQGIELTDVEREEITKMRAITKEIIHALTKREGGMHPWLRDIERLEEKTDDMTWEYQNLHLERMSSGLCDDRNCILYSKLLTDFERVGDHALNIAQGFYKIATGESAK
ncbi:MAG: Na/Pi cotransporter family protein [Erysipelotrichaceae bacterium]|nr:Na/Pi cotransporter family protein [Erysipelotrichaceae bacterium]